MAKRARELGVAFESAKIVDNRYRWGSCAAVDSVTYNWRLVKAPMFVIDYVIVHLLAHLMVSSVNYYSRRIASFKNVTEIQSVASLRMLPKIRSNGRVLPAVEAVGKWETRRVFQGRGATDFSTASVARRF